MSSANCSSDEMEELGRIQIQELEERIAMMERCDPSKNLAKQQDMMVKELKNKHQQDVVMLQKQIENLNKKLLQKVEDCSGLEKRMAELQREHEMLLVDKGNTINQLSRQLDESQAQCRQLMAANVSVENVRLQNQLDEVAREKDRLNETVRTLQIECNMMRSELAQYETVSRLNLPQSNSSSEESDSIVQLGMSTRTSQSQQLGRTNLNQTDTICKLKAELNRSFLNQKAKRAEIQRLTQIVNEKEDQVQELVKRERVYVAQFETLNDQLNKMKAEFKCLKSEQQKVDSCDRSEEISNLNTVIAELRKEKVVMEREKLAVQQELEDLKKDFEADRKREISDCNKEYLKFHDQTVATVKKEIEEKADLQVKEYSIRLEQSLKELSEVKEMYLSVCTAKEQLALSLQERTAELGQVTEKKEQLTRELQELTVMRDQLARRLNERETSKIRNQTGNKNENEEQIAEILQLKTELHKAELQINSSRRNENQLSAECKRLREELSVMSARLTVEINSARKLEQVTADKNRLAAELQEMRDHLAHKLTEQKTAETAASHVEAKEENDKLNAEILRFKTELQKAELLINTSQRRESQLSAECERLREDLSAMSARHTLEISSAREELRDSRERLIQLEKNARTQFETEMKSLRQDRDMLKTKCDEKEVQIMKLIESRKRAPATVTVATETEDEEEEKQQRELIRCQEEYNRVLVDMEQGHRQALRKLREEYNNERMALVQEHKQQLQAVEEHTKQLTVKFFAEEVKKLEAKYVDEVSNVVENLQKSLLEKNCLVENLQKRLVSLEDEWREKLVALNREMEAEKEIAAQMMVQWAEEMKKIQEELARKEEVIENQRTKLAKAKAMEQRHREKLIRNNEVFQTQYKKKCDEFKEIFKEAKEEAFEKLKQLDKVYEDEIKKIQKKEEMRIKALEKKLQQKS
ncbi:centrosomal protein of 152 kDa-like isoform X2 [Homalodisca vitripennis]|uniref:centrosomal protein of 152 kDa-like isoform X2 n=1 Tax=Homalodisca vitripennis TaxID=197043 RepID=UPI001EEBF7BE|nr:centrosomal protein of 152 kDa-like isoform X2 [Homalodisca vitripennis]